MKPVLVLFGIVVPLCLFAVFMMVRTETKNDECHKRGGYMIKTFEKNVCAKLEVLL